MAPRPLMGLDHTPTTIPVFLCQSSCQSYCPCNCNYRNQLTSTFPIAHSTGQLIDPHGFLLSVVTSHYLVERCVWFLFWSHRFTSKAWSPVPVFPTIFQTTISQLFKRHVPTLSTTCLILAMADLFSKSIALVNLLAARPSS